MLIAPKPKTKFQLKQSTVLKTDRQLCVARYSPDGDTIAAGGFDGKVRRWDVSKDKPAELPAWDTGGGWVQDVAFHPDGKRLFTADSWGRLQCWDLAAKTPKAVWSKKDAHAGWIHALAVSPDGTLVATASIDGTVRVWSTADGKRKHTFADHDVETFSVAFHPDGKSLVSGDLYGRVRIRDVATGKTLRELDAKILYKEHRLQDIGGARVFAFDTAGARLFVAGTKPKNGGNVQGVPTVLVFDWKTGKLQQTIEMGKTSDVYVCGLHLHADGYLIAVTSGNPGAGKLLCQRLDEKEPFFSTKKMPNLHSLCVHPTGKRLAVSATNSGSNGNGRRLKDGEYLGNYSPIHVLEIPKVG